MLKNPYVLPVTSQPNQTFKTVIPLGARNVELTIQLSFREVAGYWTMNLIDKSGHMLFANLPLFKGGNLLYQYPYLDLGYLTVLQMNPNSAEYPGAGQLGSDFILVWGEDDG